jgi:hypothetical protein
MLGYQVLQVLCYIRVLDHELIATLSVVWFSQGRRDKFRKIVAWTGGLRILTGRSLRSIQIIT